MLPRVMSSTPWLPDKEGFLEQILTIRRPDDWHVHFRDGDILRAVVPYTARQFGRAIVMPNLVPPVNKVSEIKSYRDRILSALPEGVTFTPLMTAYLTEDMDIEDVVAGAGDGLITGVKLYPLGATTNSDSGVKDLKNVTKILERMQEVGLPLLLHGEVTDPEADIFDREALFIERVLIGLRADFPELKIVFEHVTTKDAVDYVLSQESHLGCTVTAHHLIINRTDIFRGGIRPHLYCLPIAKREEHRQALRIAVTSGDRRFFLGTDTAPHSIQNKETGCGCAGIFSAPTAIELYAHVFDEEGALDQLEAFASLNGPGFYGLPLNKDTIRLSCEMTEVPESISISEGEFIQVFHPYDTLNWRLLA